MYGTTQEDYQKLQQAVVGFVNRKEEIAIYREDEFSCSEESDITGLDLD